jgi:hypothetical protein
MAPRINKKCFTIPLTLEDELYCEITTEEGKLIFFVIEYNATIENNKQTIFRVDTKHGYAHKHIYHKTDKNDRAVTLSDCVDEYGYYYNEELKYLKNNFSKIKDNYLNN